MAELISDVAQKFELTARTREVNLRIDVPGRLPLVNADVSMIERVVTNLLDNAIRHTPSGGEIRLAVWQENERLQVEVAEQWYGRRCLAARRFVPAAFSVKSSGVAREPWGIRAVNREENAGAARRWDQADGVRERGAVQVLCTAMRNCRVALRYPAYRPPAGQTTRQKEITEGTTAR